MSLKRDLQCPHCECRQVWHIAEMHERGAAAPFEKPIAPSNVVLQQKFFKPDEPNGVFLLDGDEAERNRGPYR